MDLTFIIGTLISVLLSYWGIWYSKKQRTRIELSLIDRYGVPLISTYGKTLESLEALNYKFPFDANQFYFRGVLINTGNVDIYRNIILKPLKLTFNEGIKIISFKVLNSNPDIEVKYTQNEDEIIIEWDILKPLEGFTFELIAQSPKNLTLYGISKNLKIESRIAELKEVRRLSYSALSDGKVKFSEIIPTYLFLLFLLVWSSKGLIDGVRSFYRESGQVSYSVTSKFNGETVELKYYNEDSILLNGQNTKDLVSVHDLEKRVQVSPKIEVKKNRYFYTAFWFLVEILILILFSFNIKTDIEKSRRGSLLKSLP